ncbi:DUF4388 domain-containing protein, partial [bacterium]|nr:DUF4388 domain-containing protein [candidate division CSSED10-310 bacterium]
MSHRGNLSKIEFTKLLSWVHNQKLSGTLRISQENKSKFILFESGEILSAYSEFPEDNFRAVIRRMQLLPETQQLDLDLEPGISDGQFARWLIEKGYVTEREFLEVLKRLNQDILLSLFEWRKGEFYFYENKFPESKAISLKIPIKWLFEKGVERYQQRRDIDSRLPVEAVFKVRDESFRQAQIAEHPYPEVRRFFEALSEPRNIRDIVSESLLTEFEVVTSLLRYLEQGDIETVTVEAPEIPETVKKLLAEAEILYAKKRYWEAWMRLRKALVEVPNDSEIQQLHRKYTI